MTLLTSFNGRYWKNYIDARVRPQFEQFGNIALKRIIPAFDGINEEATALEQRRYTEMMETADVPEQDYWEAGEAAADLAFNEAMNHAVMLSSMRFATVNMLATSLYHLHEQQLVDLCTQVLDYWGQEGATPNEVLDWFKKEVGIDPRTLNSWPLVEELCLVANVVKHGEGRSSKALRELRPEVFIHPSVRGTDSSHPSPRVRTPLFGQDVYVTVHEFRRYHSALVAFWTELAEALPALTRQSQRRARSAGPLPSDGV
jgi:hypothetical protein